MTLLDIIYLAVLGPHHYLSCLKGEVSACGSAQRLVQAAGNVQLLWLQLEKGLKVTCLSLLFVMLACKLDQSALTHRMQSLGVHRNV